MTFSRRMIGPSLLGLSCLLSLLMVTGCTPSPNHVVEGGRAQIELPPTSGVFDYQLGGAIDTVDTVDTADAAGGQSLSVVVRDLSDAPLPGAYNICYLNGFQTQPGSSGAHTWQGHEHLLLHTAEGEPVVDPDWPDEIILDTATSENRTEIAGIIGEMILQCHDAGYQAIELDNLDVFDRFDAVSKSATIELAATLAADAHALGLAVGQKNAAELGPVDQKHIGFDFAIAESCGAWQECAAYTSRYGAHVLQIEYPETLAKRAIDFDQVCADPDRAPLTILRDRGLRGTAEAGRSYRACASTAPDTD